MRAVVLLVAALLQFAAPAVQPTTSPPHKA